MRSTLSFFILSLAMGLILQGAAASPPIVGGSEVSASDPVAQTTVLLKTGPHLNDLCSASLVSDQFAITAAHCLTGAVDGNSGRIKTTEKLQIIFGTNLSEASTIQKVSPVIGAIFNPSYQANASQDRADVGVVKFSGGLPPGYHGVHLLPATVALTSGEKVILAGFGTNDVHAGSGFGVLRKAEVQIAPQQPSQTEITFDQSRGRGACYGDSGGPAFLIQAGIPLMFAMTSRGSASDHDCMTSTIFTKIRPHLEFFRWASNQMKAQ